MEIKYLRETISKNSEIESYLKEFEDVLGKKIIITFLWRMGNNFRVSLTNTETNIDYEIDFLRFTLENHVIYNKIVIIDSNMKVIEYQEESSKGGFCRLDFERHGFVNNGIYILKRENQPEWLLSYGSKECVIRLNDNGQLTNIIKEIKELDLVNIYKMLKEKDANFVKNIQIKVVNIDEDREESITIANGELINYERKYINDKQLGIIITYKDDTVSFSATGKINNENLKINQQDVVNEVENIKRLVK